MGATGGPGSSEEDCRLNYTWCLLRAEAPMTPRGALAAWPVMSEAPNRERLLYRCTSVHIAAMSQPVGVAGTWGTSGPVLAPPAPPRSLS